MSWYSAPQLFSGSVIGALGLFVLFRAPLRPINRAFAAFSLLTAVWLLTVGVAYSLNNNREDLAFMWLRISYTAVIFMIVPYFRLASLVGHPLRITSRWMQLSWVLGMFFVLTVWKTDWFMEGVYLHHFGFYPRVGWLHSVYLVWLGNSLLLSHVMLFLKTRELPIGSYARNTAKYFWAALISVTPVVLDFVPNYGIDIYPIGFIFVLAFAVTTAYAIMQHQLMDIRVVIRRGVVYSILVAGITACYLAVVVAMEKLFQGFFGYRSVFSTAIAAFLIAIFFNPLRDRIQAAVDRALFSATTPELATQREQLLTEVRKGDQMKAVATLAAGLAHEIKNPLASIKTFTEYLSTRHDDPEFRAKFQKIVGGEVERINLIVQQLLEFAKPVPPKLMPVEIPILLDETLEFLGGELVQRHVEVSRHYEARPQVLGDPQQLKQVFLNLFLNSLQAMNGHGLIDIRTATRGTELEVTVSDDGEGIAPKDLPHIFDPFYTTKPTGTGLGLAVVQGIIKEHGGRIQVQSQAGQGTTMRLFLPIAI